MKKLEDKILKKVYILETKKTVTSSVVKTLVFVLSGLGAFLFIQILAEEFFDMKTFSLFEIMQEDGEVIIKHIGGVLSSVFQEIPISMVLITLFFIVILMVVSLTFVRNFGKIRHRTVSLFKFWVKREKKQL